MVKKILICSMCLMLLFGISISAQREMPQGNPPSNRERQQGNPPSGMQRPQEQGQNQQGQNAQQMTPPNMNFGSGNMPDGFGRNNTQLEAESMTFMGFVKEYQTPIISMALLLLAFVFIKLYKRKNY